MDYSPSACFVFYSQSLQEALGDGANWLKEDDSHKVLVSADDVIFWMVCISSLLLPTAMAVPIVTRLAAQF